MGETVTHKIIRNHLAGGIPDPGEPVALSIDQVLSHDATGPLCALQLEAMGVDEVRPKTVVAYIDHLMLEDGPRNADDHVMWESAAQRFGMWFSRAGNGISHPVHQQNFGVPGETLIGADSHTPAAGALGMFAIGAGGLDVALVMAGEPFWITMPEVWGIHLKGELPDWVSAKDIILELLRRHGVAGGRGTVLEFYGSGLRQLSVMDRHVICNMGVEMGALTSLFPSDEATRAYLEAQGRGQAWTQITADDRADYAQHDEVDLSKLEPLIAKPSSPDNVVPVHTLMGAEIAQSYIGSSANPGYRDAAVVASIVAGRRLAAGVSLDVNPASRQALEQLVAEGHVASLVKAGARIHQTGCNGCVGLGQAPATGGRSLRTVPRNFPGRSGTLDDAVYLCSPETAAASALTGVITDPRTLGMAYPKIAEPRGTGAYDGLILPPMPRANRPTTLKKGPGHVKLPQLDPIPDRLELPVLLKLGDNISTDGIMPSGSASMSVWNNVSAMSAMSFRDIDASYVERAGAAGDHAVIAGANYGQGSSREHAALGPRQLGLRVVIAGSIARIHGENLVNYGVLPLTFENAGDADRLKLGNTFVIEGIRSVLDGDGTSLSATVGGVGVTLRLDIAQRQRELLLAGGAIPWMREKLQAA
jgi:aconitate hydratase